MESRSYMFSTAKKRSTLLKSEPIKYKMKVFLENHVFLYRFPREDESAPRIKIYQRECPDSYTTFRQVLIFFNKNRFF